jgi:acyl-CoA thioesterase-1
VNWLTFDLRRVRHNDRTKRLVRSTPEEIDMRKTLKTIIATARTRGIEILLTGMEAPPNYGAAYTTEFRQAFSDLAREHKVTFVPFYLQGVAGDPTLNISDGIHPNRAGARIVEATIWRALEPLLSKPR